MKYLRCIIVKLEIKKQAYLYINLLLIQDYYVLENGEEMCDDDNEDLRLPKYHYVLIKDISRLLRSQLTSYIKKCYVCDRYINVV